MIFVTWYLFLVAGGWVHPATIHADISELGYSHGWLGVWCYYRQIEPGSGGLRGKDTAEGSGQLGFNLV